MGKGDRFELREDRVVEKRGLFSMNCFENFPHDANSCGERVALLWGDRGRKFRADCLASGRSLGAYADMSIKRRVEFF
ncbi:hypothetical protein A33K_15917 [Burkholderia humptydooensis MSMB43]|uniref:Uncharacterized protein n=1 Tax=Burkholderia humptydooensis MSMB43 TaxID=441157 RepID=A0ABN0G6Q5_9BURK|nr:hypothetical protein A33K_15917 [Burkholderia humptydooensis MSMB43]